MFPYRTQDLNGPNRRLSSTLLHLSPKHTHFQWKKLKLRGSFHRIGHARDGVEARRALLQAQRSWKKTKGGRPPFVLMRWLARQLNLTGGPTWAVCSSLTDF